MLGGLLLASAMAAPIRLDFGPEDGEVLDGFVEVTPFRSDHPEVRWVEPPDAGRALSWLDPLADDHVHGGTVHLDLAPGTYAVAALFQERGFWYEPYRRVENGLRTPDGSWVVRDAPSDGQAYFEDVVAQGVARPRFTAENTPWERQIAPAIRWRLDTLTVPEGGIDLEVRGRQLSALVVQPGDVASLEVELALIDADRRRAWIDRKAVWPDPGVFATEGLSGVEPVALDAWPTPDGARTEVSLELALSPGERRVVQLAVHGGDDPAQLDLTGLDQLSTSLFEVDWLDVKVSKRILRPSPHTLRPLAPGEVLTGGQGLLPIVAVEVAVDADAPPGEHTGQLSISRGEATVVVPIRVRVRELVLAEAPVPWGFWSDLRGPVAAVFGPNSDIAKQRWASEVAHMRRWGVERVSIRGAFRPSPRLRPEDAEVQFERIRWAVETFRGGRAPEPGDVQWHDPKFNVQNRAHHGPDGPVFDAEAARFVRQLFELAAELQVSVYVSDEETMHYGPGQAPRIARRIAAIRELSGEVDLTLSSPHSGGWPNGSRLLDRVYTSAQPQIDPRHRDFFDDGRAEFWAYNLGWQREATGALPYLLEPRGLLLWHFNDSNAAPFNELARRRRYTMVMPSPDPGVVWANRRLIRLGHGGFDQRYYGTLALMVEELGDRKRPKVRRAVDQACLLLDTAGAGMVGLRFDSFDDRPMRDARSLQALQDEVADTAEVLARWSRAQRSARSGRDPLGRGAFLPDRCRTEPRPVSPHADPDDVPPLEAP